MEKNNLIVNERRDVSASHGPEARKGTVTQPPEAVSGPSGPPGEVRIIPVGQEPRRQDNREEGVPDVLNRGGEQPKDEGLRHSGGKQAKRPRDGIRDPEGFYRYLTALQETQIFREQTMRHLRRSEVCVWLAIHGCQGKRGAQISHDRLAELTGTSRKHVGVAIRGLNRRGLLEVLVKGRFRPNSNGEKGLASVYRVYPSAKGQPDKMQVSG